MPGSASDCSRAARFGGVADDAALARLAFADQFADHDEAGRDADPHLEGDARARAEARDALRSARGPRAPRVRRRPHGRADSRNRRWRRRPSTWRRGRRSARPPPRSRPERREAGRPCLPDRARAVNAVKPTRSQNITVNWRRSAPRLAGSACVAAPTAASPASSRIARSIFSLCPSGIPRSLRCCSVSSVRTSASISLSRKRFVLTEAQTA